MAESVHPLTRANVFAQAWPIMLGQASVPLVGIVDAIVIGRTGDAAALAGVALGATVISLIFWSFGFLRMGMTGLTAQADGSGERDEVDALLLRGLAAGGAIGLVLMALQYPIGDLAFSLLAGGEQVSAEAGSYVAMRFFGAPAALAVFAINGWLLGLGRTRAALMLQIVMNVANIGLDLIFVWGFGMSAAGVGLGTAGAECIAFTCGLVIVARSAASNPFTLPARVGWKALFASQAMRRLLHVNRDIMIRTLALLAGFTWFANAGARLGATELAANHVLLQFINLSAFILDAFAFTAESRVGNAIGARDKSAFLRSIRLTGEFSLASGITLCLMFFLIGSPAIAFITTDEAVRAEAIRFLSFAAIIPILGMPSWLFDGIFIGATRGRALRNAGVAAAALYIMVDFALRPQGNLGVWMAFCASYLFRVGTLAIYFPALLRDLDSDKEPAPSA